jgi:glycyl-tRNA synthetase beta chain
LLAKCDLTTELVKEFPELQGKIGGLYAREQKPPEPEEVCLAIYDQYDTVPGTPRGQVVALADRLDTLHGFFGIGLIPTGSRDPFALRRAAQGVVETLISGNWEYGLDQLIHDPALQEFMLDRIRHYFRDDHGYAYDEVDAVLATRIRHVPDIEKRLKAIREVRPTENFEPLATSFKRIKKILEQAGIAEFPSDPNPELFEAGPESDLYKNFGTVRAVVKHMRDSGNYADALKQIASLRPAVDAFFDHVLVNDPDPKIRANRLHFLAQLLREFSTIADFSEIVISGDQRP